MCKRDLEESWKHFFSLNFPLISDSYSVLFIGTFAHIPEEKYKREYYKKIRTQSVISNSRIFHCILAHSMLEWLKFVRQKFLFCWITYWVIGGSITPLDSSGIGRMERLDQNNVNQAVDRGFVRISTSWSRLETKATFKALVATWSCTKW